MKSATTIRDQITAYLSEQGLSINQFAIASGINSGTLSRVIKDQQPIAMDHLERITRGMNLPEDYFYSLYVDECFHRSPPTWRRLRPFIERSAALGRLDCVEQVVQSLLDNLVYAPMLFEVAEGLFEQGLWQAAGLLYKNVSLSEKYQNSERLAICQYRLFKIGLGDDQSVNLREAILFECYIDRLNEADQLDGLKDLLDVYYSLQKWAKVNELAEKLLLLATLRYNLHHRSKRKEEHERNPRSPLYVYILRSHLFLSSVCMEYGDYKAAIEHVPQYTEVNWIQEKDDEAKRIIAQFREWGTANIYLYRLLDGQFEVLADYVEYISTKPDEIFTAMYNIVKSANRYGWNIDPILERFSDHIPYRTYTSEFGEYNQQVMVDKHTRFLAELAAYYLHSNRTEGITFILQCLESSAKINNESVVITCVDLFEQFRYIAGDDEIERYKLLIREVHKSNEKKTFQASSSV